MSDFATKLLPMVKKTLRQADNEFDDEIGSYIDTVATDLQDAGIHYSFFSSTKPGWVLDGQILQACRWYALSVFGLYNPDMEKYALAYASLKATLATQKRYTVKGQYPTGYEEGYADALANRTDIIVTENGEYTPIEGSTGFKSVTVALTKLPEIERKTVSFVDYDGAILHTYDKEEIKAMTELPSLPTRDGLICQGWNWTLDEIKQYIADFEEDDRRLYPFDVGAIYITDDGRTRFVINLTQQGVYPCWFYFGCDSSTTSSVSVDWGDGKTSTHTTRGYQQVEHTYDAPGRYTISIKPTSATLFKNGTAGTINSNSFGYVLEEVYFGDRTSIEDNVFKEQRALKIVTIPENVTSIGSSAFQYCDALKHLNIPNTVSKFGDSAFNGCGVERYTFPANISSMGFYLLSINGTSNSRQGHTKHVTLRSPVLTGYFARYLKFLTEVNFPKGLTAFPGYGFYSTWGLREVFAPSTITAVNNDAFGYCMVRLCDFSACRQIPTLASATTFDSSVIQKIVVPAHMLDDWKAATNWSRFATIMVGKEVSWANEPVKENV